MTADLFVDLSSNNPLPNLRRHFKAGHRVLALKVSEGTSYAWSDYGRLADEWHRRGGQVWHYHFARSGNGAAQARRFLTLVNPHYKGGDRIVLDVEAAGVGAAFVRDFIGTLHAAVPTWPGVVYSFASFLSAGKIRPSHGWGLWLAAYQPTQPKPVAGWARLTAWQFTDHATVAGLRRPVDCSRLLDVPAPVKPPVTPPGLSAHDRAWLRRALRKIRHLLHLQGGTP